MYLLCFMFASVEQIRETVALKVYTVNIGINIRIQFHSLNILRISFFFSCLPRYFLTYNKDNFYLDTDMLTN